jgi:hypothetical protein
VVNVGGGSVRVRRGGRCGALRGCDGRRRDGAVVAVARVQIRGLGGRGLVHAVEAPAVEHDAHERRVARGRGRVLAREGDVIVVARVAAAVGQEHVHGRRRVAVERGGAAVLFHDVAAHDGIRSGGARSARGRARLAQIEARVEAGIDQLAAGHGEADTRAQGDRLARRSRRGVRGLRHRVGLARCSRGRNLGVRDAVVLVGAGVIRARIRDDGPSEDARCRRVGQRVRRVRASARRGARVRTARSRGRGARHVQGAAVRARVLGILRHGSLHAAGVHHQVVERKLVRNETAARRTQAGRQ